MSAWDRYSSTSDRSRPWVSDKTMTRFMYRPPGSNQNSLAVVDLVLDELGRPAGEGLEAGLKLLVLILNLDRLPAFGLPGAGEGETALLCLVGAGFFDDFQVEHYNIFALVVRDDDPLADTDHIGRYAHTAVLVGGQGVQQVLGDGQVLQGGWFGLLGEEGFVSHDLSYHILRLHYVLPPEGNLWYTQ